MPDQPFHHGHLRAELLDGAERLIQERGPEALSLRELARQAGVSHGAPRRHFADRKALLDAVAERGFRRLTASLSAAAASAGDAPAERFRAAATAYVAFAANESHLHDLMFSVKTGTSQESLRAAAEEFITTSNQVLAPAEQVGAAPDDFDPRRLLIVVALQGTAALIAAGRLPPAVAETVLDEARRTFFPGGAQVDT